LLFAITVNRTTVNHAIAPRATNFWVKLSADEIRSVWNCCDAVGRPFGPIFKLLLVTAQRREEVGRMRWADLDLGKGTWTIRRFRGNARRTTLLTKSRCRV
jgi:integrase